LKEGLCSGFCGLLSWIPACAGMTLAPRHGCAERRSSIASGFGGIHQALSSLKRVQGLVPAEGLAHFTLIPIFCHQKVQCIVRPPGCAEGQSLFAEGLVVDSPQDEGCPPTVFSIPQDWGIKGGSNRPVRRLPWPTYGCREKVNLRFFS